MASEEKWNRQCTRSANCNEVMKRQEYLLWKWNFVMFPVRVCLHNEMFVNGIELSGCALQFGQNGWPTLISLMKIQIRPPGKYVLG